MSKVILFISLLFWVSFAMAQDAITTTPITSENVTELQVLAVLEGHADAVTDGVFAKDGANLITVSDDASLVVWSMETLEPLSTHFEHFSFIKDIAVNPQTPQEIATGSWDQSVIRWDIESEPTALSQWQDVTAVIDSVDYNITGDLIAYGAGDGIVRIVDIETEEILESIQLDALHVIFARHSPFADLLAITAGFPENTVHLYDTESYEEIGSLVGHAGAVTTIAFLSNGGFVTGGDDSTVRIWSDDGEELQTLEQPDWVTDILLSNDESLLFVALQNGDVTIWNLNTYEQINVIEAHELAVNKLALNKANTLLATMSDDNSVKLWSVSTED